jgi:hypothetical protein
MSLRIRSLFCLGEFPHIVFLLLVGCDWFSLLPIRLVESLI